MKIEKSTGAGIIDVTYENVPGGLRAAGEPQGFALLDADGIPQPLLFKTTLHGNTARLHLVPDTCPGEVRLFYGPGHTPVCNLTDGRDFALPVFGPLAFAPREARLPFVTRWRKTPLVTTPAAPLAALPCPDLTAATAAAAAWPGGTTIATWGPDGFINEHAHWQGHAGHAYFAATLTLPEPMKLDVLTGYDGPFRLWLDRKPFHTALDGINPCIPDEGRKTTTLAAGPHTLTVAMDINNGAAWGFFLRFRRRDLTAAQLKSGDYARPAYDV
jgi:sialate O-acetylesterase